MESQRNASLNGEDEELVHIKPDNDRIQQTKEATGSIESNTQNRNLEDEFKLEQKPEVRIKLVSLLISNIVVLL